MIFLVLVACWISEVRNLSLCDTGQHAVDSTCVDDKEPYVIPGDDSADDSADDSGA